MKYEEVFTDWDKMLSEGIIEGFTLTNFTKLYQYLYKRKGMEFANRWMLQDKRNKRLYCAKMLMEYIDNEGLRQKAQKYINKCSKRDKKLR